jgi:hypothetical protein
MSLEYVSSRDRAIADEEATRLLDSVSGSSLLRVLKTERRTLLFDDGRAGEELGRFDVDERGVYLAFRGGSAAWNQVVRTTVEAALRGLGGFSALELD